MVDIVPATLRTGFISRIASTEEVLYIWGRGVI